MSCLKSVKDTFRAQEESWDFSQVASAKKGASARVEGRISWFFSSCGWVLSSYDGDLRDPLLWPQERPVSMRVAGASWDSSPIGDEA